MRQRTCAISRRLEDGYCHCPMYGVCTSPVQQRCGLAQQQASTAKQGSRQYAS